jgi:hypothetical protein
MSSNVTVMIALTLTVSLARRFGLISADEPDTTFTERNRTVNGSDEKGNALAFELPDYIYNLGTADDPDLVAVAQMGDDEGAEVKVQSVILMDDNFYWESDCSPVLYDDGSESDDTDEGDDTDEAEAEAEADTTQEAASEDSFDDLAKPRTPTKVQKNKPGRKKSELVVWYRPLPGADLANSPALANLVDVAGNAIDAARQAQYEAQKAATRAQSAIHALRKVQNQKLPAAPALGDGLAMWATKTTIVTEGGGKAAQFSWKDTDAAITYTFTATRAEIEAHIASRPKDATEASQDVLAVELYDLKIVEPARQARALVKGYIEQLESYRLNDNLSGGAVRNILGKRAANKPRKVSKKKTAEQIAQSTAEVQSFLNDLD